MTPVLAILGPGTLGLSLARHAAAQGFEVRLLGRNREHVEAALSRLAERWPDSTRHELSRIRPQDSLAEALEGALALMEALPEDLEVKQRFWREAAPGWPSATLALTGSSCLPARLLCTDRRVELQNFHPFVPVHRHPLVELSAPEDTSPAHRQAARDLAALLGLQAVEISPSSGLVAARMGLIQGLEAMRLLEEGAASAPELDALLVHGYGHPCGPLELSDRIGLDLRLTIADHLAQATGLARFQPPAILREKVKRGDLGRKTGQGFFAWNSCGERA